MEFQQFERSWLQCLREFFFARALLFVELVACGRHQLRRHQRRIRRHLLFLYYFRKSLLSGERPLGDRASQRAINDLGRHIMAV